MWICPVCGIETDDAIYICTACGFDERKNFQKYPSLIPLDAAAVEAVEAMWRKSLQRENARKREQIWEYEEDLKGKEPLKREEDLKDKEALNPEEDFWSRASFSDKKTLDNGGKTASRIKGALISHKTSEPEEDVLPEPDHKSALKINF